jgi:hypothetical protein
MDVPAPAIAAAIFNATGLLVTELPILPERLFAACSTRDASSTATEGGFVESVSSAFALAGRAR